MKIGSCHKKKSLTLSLFIPLLAQSLPHPKKECVVRWKGEEKEQSKTDYVEGRWWNVLMYVGMGLPRCERDGERLDLRWTEGQHSFYHNMSF